MRILTVAIPNHHFFQWVNQLKDSGYEVFWFDITDGGPESPKIPWVKQIKGWKLKWDFPFRVGVKNKLPRLYSFIQKLNTNHLESSFQDVLDSIQPDIVHCFEMALVGLPLLKIMQNNTIPLIYSSWGSDMFNSKNMGITDAQVAVFLNRVDYLITDCKRDFEIAKTKGFDTTFLGVYPGNGGISVDPKLILEIEKRDIILFKGYQYDVGEAIQVAKALELVPLGLLKNKIIVVYSADKAVETYIRTSQFFKQLHYKIYSRGKHVPNQDLLRIMGKSVIHIGNNTSDGMPNTLLEAMGMGAFPIQSNPGGASAEVISDNENGFLIENPIDVPHIAILLEKALKNQELRIKAKKYNVPYIENNYNRITLASKIESLYKQVIVDSK